MFRVRLSTAVVAVAAVLCLTTGVQASAAAITQPPQPTSGPGSSDFPNAGFRVTAGGRGADAWYVFEPTKPQPSTAPLAIITHGYYEFSGYKQMDVLIRHTVLKGSVVIYPRWQTDIVTPCPGPFDVEPCMRSEVNGIRGALAYLRARKSRVQPDLDRASYFGFSFGGIITANLANRYKQLGLPEPKAVFLDDPHDGGLNGTDEPALDDSLSGIPPTTLVQCHSGADGVFSSVGNPSDPNASRLDGSCNRVFPRLTSVPAANKDLVLTETDDHGEPPLSSKHGVCAGKHGTADTYDWGFCWKAWDALRSCASFKTDCRYALGNTPEHRYIGTWSDRVPIIGLKIQDAAPIRKLPAPARQPAPPPYRNASPKAKLAGLRASYALGALNKIAGTASDDRAVASVEVAVVRGKGRACTQMTATGAFVSSQSCTRPAFVLVAKGTTRWSLTLPARLPRGSYLIIARAVDGAGKRQTTDTRDSTQGADRE